MKRMDVPLGQMRRRRRRRTAERSVARWGRSTSLRSGKNDVRPTTLLTKQAITWPRAGWFFRNPHSKLYLAEKLDKLERKGHMLADH